MFRRHARLIALVLLLLPPFARAAAPEPSQAERLYRSYEELNSPANLAVPFAGGQPPMFIQTQAALLKSIADLPAPEAGPVLCRVADEYLRRIDSLGPERFRRSPLLALQLPILQGLVRQAGEPGVQARLDALVKDPLIKEYARGRALGALAEQRLKAIRPATDPDGSRRRQILVDILLANQSFSQLLHAPARLNALADQVAAVGGGDPLAAAKFIGPAADSPVRRYAADYATLRTLALKEAEGKPFDDRERTLLAELARRYADTFHPEVLKERYPSDLLGHTLAELAAHPGNEALANLLRDYGIQPRRPIEPPTDTEIVQEPTPETRDSAAELLGKVVEAVKDKREADAERILRKLGAPAAFPALQELLGDTKMDEPTRGAAFRALAHNGSEQAVFMLLDAARRTDDPKKLDPIVFALTEVKNPAAIPAVLEAVLDGTDARLGGACAHVLARLPRADKANSLLKAYRDNDIEAVHLLVALAKDWATERGASAGLAGLASLALPDAVDALFDLLSERAISDSPERLAAVERAASRAVSLHADDPEALTLAIGRLKAASPTVRRAAAHALAGLRDDPGVRRALEEAAQAEKDPDLAKTLRTYLQEPPKKN